jgi:hypothetical protein
MKEAAMMQAGPVARLLAGNIRPVLNVQASELPTQTTGQPWRAKVPPQMQGIVIINGTAARFTVQIWEGGEGTGVGDLRVPVGAWEWVAVPACATAVGIDPTSVSGAAGGAGIIEIYGTEYHPEFAAGRLSEQPGEWWLDIVLPTAMPGRYSYTWTSPWGGTVTWVPGNFKGLTGTYWGRLRIAAGFAGSAYLEAQNDPIDVTILDGFSGSLSVIDYGYDIVEIGRYCEGYIVVGNIPAGWSAPVNVPASALAATHGFNRIRIGDLVTGQIVVTGTSAQAAQIDVGELSPGSVTLYGMNQTVRVGRGYTAAVTDVSNANPASYSRVVIGDESSLTVNLTAGVQGIVQAGHRTQGTIYIGQPPITQTVSYNPTIIVRDGRWVNIGSSTAPFYGCPRVPILVADVPYSSFAANTGYTTGEIVGAIRDAAFARKIIAVSTLNEAIPSITIYYTNRSVVTKSPVTSAAWFEWSLSSGLVPAAPSGGVAYWEGDVEVGSNNYSATMIVDILDIVIGMGATAPTSGSLQLYIWEDVEG